MNHKNCQFLTIKAQLGGDPLILRTLKTNPLKVGNFIMRGSRTKIKNHKVHGWLCVVSGDQSLKDGRRRSQEKRVYLVYVN